MTLWLCGLAIALLDVVSRVASAAPPAFAVRVEGEGIRQYRVTETMRVSDDFVAARVRAIGPEEWELALKARTRPITSVWFPWEPERVAVPRTDRAILYYPRLMGVAVEASQLRDWAWEGGPYPGECYAPLVVVADDTAARMVAATNWPPRRVTPMYSLERLTLRYDERSPVGSRRTYRALVVRTGGSASERPWQAALSRYKAWLGESLASAGLVPSHPEWLHEMHGWLNVQLQNMATWDAARVDAAWTRWGRELPWVQFWGQMSDYFRPGGFGIQNTGCCLDRSDLHARYRPELLRLVRKIARSAHVGFYARPISKSGPFLVPGTATTTPEYAFLQRWLARNRVEYGANAFYIDVVGGRDYGNPYEVAKLLQDDTEPATVIERAVDVYPSASLMSGALGGGSWRGGPGSTRAELSAGFVRTTFPSFGRYLLADRVIFLGESNADGRWWGPKAEYWTERQAFLLGAKFDVIHPTEDGKPDGPEDQALALAVAVRDAADWWSRRPEYLDRRGLGAVPEGVDVRRYRGRGGEGLLVVDNWERRNGLHIALDGQDVALPADAFSIVVLPKPPAE